MNGLASYFDAIQELVEDNNNYMTPSPLDEETQKVQNNNQLTLFFPNYTDYYSEKKIMPGGGGYSPEMMFNQHQDFNPVSTAPYSSFINTESSMNYGKPFQPLTVDFVNANPTDTSSKDDEDDDDDGTESLILDLNVSKIDFENSASDIINDNDLVTLPVRQLNMRLKNLTKDEKIKLKSRRRLLKNRGYAQTCRTRRIDNQKSMFDENDHLKKLLQQVTLERNLYQTKYESLKAVIKKAKLEREKRQIQQ